MYFLPTFLNTCTFTLIMDGINIHKCVVINNFDISCRGRYLVQLSSAHHAFLVKMRSRADFSRMFEQGDTVVQLL